jgi:hypothetical protein
MRLPACTRTSLIPHPPQEAARARCYRAASAFSNHSPRHRMKISRILLAFLTLACLALPAAAAEKKKKPKVKREPVITQVDEPAVAVLKPYDKDGNFEIDRTELAAMQTAYKADPTGPLKAFDQGKDGDLDELIDRAGMNVKLGAVPMAEADKKRAEQAKKKAAKAAAKAEAATKAEAAAKAAK